MEPDAIAELAGAISDSVRVAVLLVLMDGCMLPAGELAQIARVAPSTMSAHLAQLVDCGILACEKTGRHRYFRISGPQTARLIEDLGAMAGAKQKVAAQTRVPRPLQYARRCYNHLAGTLAVELNAAGQRESLWREVAPKHYEITREGAQWLGQFDLRVPAKQHGFASGCLDWSERRFHIGGNLGSLLLAALMERKWLATGQTPRSLRVTTAGREEFWKQLRINVPASLDGRESAVE